MDISNKGGKQECKMYGLVTKYFDDRGYGFIQCDTDGELYFIHKKDLNGEYIETGCYVYFVGFKTNRRKHNAAILYVVESAERK